MLDTSQCRDDAVLLQQRCVQTADVKYNNFSPNEDSAVCQKLQSGDLELPSAFEFRKQGIPRSLGEDPMPITQSIVRATPPSSNSPGRHYFISEPRGSSCARHRVTPHPESWKPAKQAAKAGAANKMAKGSVAQPVDNISQSEQRSHPLRGPPSHLQQGIIICTSLYTFIFQVPRAC